MSKMTSEEEVVKSDSEYSSHAPCHDEDAAPFSNLSNSDHIHDEQSIADSKQDKTTKELSETDICPSVLNGELDNDASHSTRTNGLICSLSNSAVLLGTCDDKSNKGYFPFLSDCDAIKGDCKSDENKKLCENANSDEVSSTEPYQSTEKVNAAVKINTSETDSENELCAIDNSFSDNIDINKYALKVPKNPLHNGELPESKRSSLKRSAEDNNYGKNAKRRRGIQFDGVTVFYFPRSQGFTCVPSQGGSTLGMSHNHFFIKQYSLSEHAAEQRRSHKEYLLRVRQQKCNEEKKDMGSQCSSSEDSEENSEEASDVSDSEVESESFFFLQPLPIRQRRALLRQSGIRQIEGVEKEDCKDIRISREMCGCQCKMYCHPNTCQCAQAGIKCQVDRHSFPCGCSRDGCGNPNGRIEFNPIRVRTHFLHTLMRLEIEKRQNSGHCWSNQPLKNGTEAHTNDTSWLSQTGGCSSEGFGLSVPLGRALPFFGATGSTGLSAGLQEINSCGANVVPPSYMYDRHNKENSSCSFLDNRDYSPNSCGMFGSGISSPFDSLSSLTSFGDCSSPFHPQSNLSSCYNSNSFSKFASCSSSAFSSSLSCSAAMAMLVPGAPFAMDGSCSTAISPTSSSCGVNLAKLLPPDDSSRFNMNDFSPQNYIPITEKTSAEASLTSMLDNIEDIDKSKKSLSNLNCVLASSCLSSCNDSLSCLQGPSTLQNLDNKSSSLPDYSVSHFGVTDVTPTIISDCPVNNVTSSSCETKFGICSNSSAMFPCGSFQNLSEESESKHLLLLDDKPNALKSKTSSQCNDIDSSCIINSEDVSIANLASEKSRPIDSSPIDILRDIDSGFGSDCNKRLDNESIPAGDLIINSTVLVQGDKNSDENSNTNSWCSVNLDCVPKCSSPIATSVVSHCDGQSVNNGASLKGPMDSDLLRPSTCLARPKDSHSLPDSSTESSTRTDNDNSVMETVNA